VAADGGRTNDLPPALERLGWDAGWEDDYRKHAAADCFPARVTRSDRGMCTVHADGGELRVELRPGQTGGQPAVGDWVVVHLASDRQPASVAAVLPRRTVFSRGRPGGETVEQVVAANVDVVLLVNSLGSQVNLRRIERYLTLGWQSGATPVIVLTKTDLCDDVESAVAAVGSIAFGVPVHAVSAVTGDGLDEVAGYAEGNRTVALLGLSGVGKSTLVNRLRGEDLLATQDVRSDGKGRHTTTHRELVPLPAGGVLLDTPGMRGLQLWDADEGLGETFGDVEELAAACRFADCAHEGEPGCAVMEAIRGGTLPQERLVSYRKLQRELRFLESRQDWRLRSEERRKWRLVAKSQRAHQDLKRR
jgi:ribosome biogenesis GTPase